MNARQAEQYRKIIWHIRWILLVGVMVWSGIYLFSDIEGKAFLATHGIVWALYFFLTQIEGYLECKSNCKI